MIAVIDYDTGNLRSVTNALVRLGTPFAVTSDAEQIRRASHVILPGVGQAALAMQALKDKGLVEVIISLRQPVLGICIGMQLLCRHSEEGGAECLGIFDTEVSRLADAPGLKIPHMGWDSVENLRSPLLDGLDEGIYFYYVHSYAPALCAQTVATTHYGTRFSAVLQRGNFFGVQFHPEKSGAAGERLLKNFIGL